MKFSLYVILNHIYSKFVNFFQDRSGSRIFFRWIVFSIFYTLLYYCYLKEIIVIEVSGALMPQLYVLSVFIMNFICLLGSMPLENSTLWRFILFILSVLFYYSSTYGLCLLILMTNGYIPFVYLKFVKVVSLMPNVGVKFHIFGKYYDLTEILFSSFSIYVLLIKIIFIFILIHTMERTFSYFFNTIFLITKENLEIHNKLVVKKNYCCLWCSMFKLLNNYIDTYGFKELMKEWYYRFFVTFLIIFPYMVIIIIIIYSITLHCIIII